MTTDSLTTNHVVQGPLADAYGRYTAMEAALNVELTRDPPEMALAASEAIEEFSRHAREDVAMLFDALMFAADLGDRFKLCLVEMVHAYSGYIPAEDLSRTSSISGQDLIEMRLYQSWLKATGVLGIDLKLSNTRAQRAQRIAEENRL